MRQGIQAAMAGLFLVFLLGVPQAGSAYETPVAPSASAILPGPMLSGPNFVVDPVVGTDGYLYVYTLHTNFGDVRAASTAQLATRIAETAALAKMEQVSSLQEFGGGIVQKGEQTVQGAVNLIQNPLGTISGAFTGVGRMFTSMSQDLTSGGGSAGAKLLGVPALARQYAVQFGVDPYTTNPLVQARLTALAQAGAAGNITGTALAALIPGGVGIAVSAVGTTATLNTIDLTASPVTIAQQNQALLTGMGVSADAASYFVGNQAFTPTQQSRIVAALANMPAVGNKNAFISFLADTGDPDVAYFRQRMAQMYAGYHAGVSPLTGFVPVGRHVAAINAAGKLVLVFPTDCFFWTETNAAIAQAFNTLAQTMPTSGVEIWAAGRVSPAFARHLRAMGWTVRENSAQRLLGQPY
ncbi:MAG: hypothetical protein B193_0051 [Solidesulfovibrio magneticus str. Maddingley MBC34]|uniref:Uncharacterized protein n=1 Tax=Solidesulfovibrio magneticus str. Maddingley MBC34 TaxID=1206767 RepID=K6GWG5_9BACT|nr:MAG: hypothetical protein B193_0051 [Solidesulfovibrio magneticus str. Maddingley MBC34]